MKVTVYHNLSRDASFGLNTVFEADAGTERGYVKRPARTEDEKHQLVKVFEYEAGPAGSKEELNRAWEEFNVGTGLRARAYRARRLRSLSVGDVVVVGPDAFSVESFGFKDRYASELRLVEDPVEAERLVRERYEFRSGEKLAVTVPWDR